MTVVAGLIAARFGPVVGDIDLRIIVRARRGMQLV
jgi:hypothetical protein